MRAIFNALSSSALRWTLCLPFAACTGCAGGGPTSSPSPSPTPTPSPTPAPKWKVAQQDLPSALLSVQVAENGTLYAVGSDSQDGKGGYVLRYDGSAWTRLLTGVEEDFWWVHQIAADEIWICGTNRTTLRYTPSTGEFEQVDTPDGAQTLFGIWGLSSDDIWTVGGALGPGGVIMHFDGDAWSEVDVTEAVGGALPSMFKVWGPVADDIYFVGTGGTTLRFDGSEFTHAQTPEQSTIFTVYGTTTGDIVTAVGGFQSGYVGEWVNGVLTNVTPDGAVQVNGVNFNSSGVGRAAGIFATTLIRTAGGWVAEDNGLDAINDLDFHGIWVESNGDAWAVGGNTTVAPLDRGVIAYYGSADPTGPIGEQ